MFKKDDFSKTYELKKELPAAPDSPENDTKLYEAKLRKQNKSVAAKIISKRNLSNERKQRQVDNEISIIKNLPPHVNIVKFVESIETTSKLYIINEFITGRNLFDVLKPLQPVGLKEPEAASIVLQLARALEHLHDLNIVHRNLKPSNVLIRADGVVKLTGFSSAVSCKRTVRGVAGVVYYMAPEMLLKIPYKTHPDMWSLGVLTFFMLGGYIPFFHRKTVLLCTKIVETSFTFDEDRWSLISKDAKSLISQLLILKERRATAKEIQTNGWVKNATLPEALLTEEQQQKAKETMNLLKEAMSTLKVVSQFESAIAEEVDEEEEEEEPQEEIDAYGSLEDFDHWFTNQVEVENEKSNLQSKKLY